MIVYKIKNNINGKLYIGITNNLNKRWEQHKKDAFTDKAQAEKPLYNAIRKYGIESFSIELIEECLTEEKAIEKETFYIVKFNTLVKHGLGYNIKLIAKATEIIDGKLTCTSCLKNLDISNFYKNKNRKCGLQSKCKSCVRQYTLDNYEKISEYRRKYKILHKEEIAEKNKQYVLNKKEELAAHRRKRDIINKEKIAKQKRQYGLDNKEKIKETRNKYLLEHKEELAQKGREYYLNKKEEKAKKQKQYN